MRKPGLARGLQTWVPLAQMQGSMGSSAAGPPTLTSLVPTHAPQDATLVVDVYGTNFIVGASVVAFAGSGITVTSVTVLTSGHLTAALTIAAGTVVGAQACTVTTPGGTSNALAFTVDWAVPTLASVAPAAATAGETTAVTLTGNYFVAGSTTVAVSGLGAVVSAVVVVSPTTLTCTIAWNLVTSAGAHAITVTTPGGTSNPVTFTVASAAYTVEFLLVGGGANGGAASDRVGGGGGGGRHRQNSFVILPGEAKTITVGLAGQATAIVGLSSAPAGGAGGPGGANGSAPGGGGGGTIGSPGDSGTVGGAAGTSGGAGGDGKPSSGGGAGGGGGGAQGNGGHGSYDGDGVTGNPVPGSGGAGFLSDYSGIAARYGGGGGAGSNNANGSNGGAGGGGNGAGPGGAPGNAPANTGGGGGGGSAGFPAAGLGGSGIAILRYLGTVARATGGTITIDPRGYIVHTFTAGGTFTG